MAYQNHFKSKAKGPPSNLRPIILLSSLRKILAACIPNRMKDRLKVEITPSQATYRPNRSTTARNESDHLIMLGTSKGFDSINRNQLIEDLRNTIGTDELHIISPLLNLSLSVICENTLGKVFETETGGTTFINALTFKLFRRLCFVTKWRINY